MAYTVVAFGDIPASLILETAKARAADLGHHIDPEAANQIRHKMYVDNAAIGGDLQTVL